MTYIPKLSSMRKILMVTVLSVLALYALNKRFTTSPVAPLPPNYRVVIFCDTGNDPDDVFAHVYQARHMREHISLIATTLYDPQEKARVCSVIFKQLGIQPRIVSGYGATGGDQEVWMKTYPSWPLKFGIPGSTDTVSLAQGKAYREKFAKDMEEASIEIETAPQALSQLLESSEKNLVIIGQAPLTDLTKACDKIPHLLQRVDRIVLMGGWFCDETGAISRLGYNTAVDLRSAQHVLTQKDTTVLIVNSELTKHFPLKEAELQVLKKSQHKTPLGNALSTDMNAYWENKTPAKGNLGLADILTSYLAQHPEAIGQTIPVRLNFNEKLVEANIDMFNEQSKKVVQVEKATKSNIQLVTAVRNPEETRLFLISEIATLFYPNVPSDSFQKVFSRVNAENIDDIAHELNNWPKAG